MGQTKDWYESITVWGGIVAAASPILTPLVAHLGLTMSPAFQTSLAGFLAAAGGVLAVIGRMRATTTISAPTKGTTP